VRRPLLIRDLHSGRHLDLFLVSAVSTVLGIRAYLRLTNYPSIGGARLHIAHMLWGGLLMLGALVILLGFLGRRPKGWGAVLGGIGFGTFIDEIGKFVTRDNDYFYRPAVALIYITFVLIYVVLRSVRPRQTMTHQEYLVNALQEMEEAALKDLQVEERDRALHYLSRADAADPLVAGLSDLLRRTVVTPTAAPGRVARLRRALVAGYRDLTHHPAFANALIAFFVAQLVIKLSHLGVLILDPEPYANVATRLSLMGRQIEGYSVAEWLQLGSSVVSAGFVALGIIAIRRSRRDGLRMFQRSILVSIFLTQVFMFYREQWAGLLLLAFNLLILSALEFMIEREAPRERLATSQNQHVAPTTVQPIASPRRDHAD
jgi:hypothetical protein